MYTEDSFFTLGTGGQIGLAVLSALLMIAMVALTWRLGRFMPRAARVVLALTLFWAFVWLSPQIYYLYYQAIIPGLPWQIVVRDPPTLEDIARLLSFTAEQTLSAHGRGGLGWFMLATALPR